MEIKNTFAYFGNRQKFQSAIDRTGTDYLPERFNTIVFVEGQGDTPGEIWTHGKQFGGGISESQITNAINNYFNNQENVEDVLPIASYDNKGIVSIQRKGGINVNNGVISANIPDIIAGIKGADGQDGIDGLTETIWQKIQTILRENGIDGLTPRIENGYWWIGDVNTHVKASGTEVTISDDGYWVLDGTKTDVKATGGNLEGNYVKSVVYNTNNNKLSIVTVSNGVENTEEYEISSEGGNGEPEHYLKAISKTDSGNNINITITKEDDSVESFVIPAPLNSYVVSAEYNANTGNLTINSIENGASKTKTYPISSGGSTTGVTAAQLAEILQDYAEKDWVNAQGFLKSDSLSGYAKTSDLSGYITSSDLSGYASQEWVRNQGYATGTIPTEYIKTASYSSETGDMVIKNNNNTSVVEVHIPDISKGHGIDINNDVISVKESDLNVVKQVSVNPIVQEGEGKTPLATITVDGDPKTIYGYISTGGGNTTIENPYDDTELKNRLSDLENLIDQQDQRMDDLHDWSESDINRMALNAINTWDGLEGKIGPLWQAGKFDDELSTWAQRNGYVYEDGATWTDLIQRQNGIEASVTSLTETENGHYEILNGKITTATEDINGLKTAVASMGTEYVKVTDVTEDGIEASKWLGSWFKTATNKNQTLADMFSAAETSGQDYTDRAVATVNQTINTVDNRITQVNTSLGSRLSVVENGIERINQSGFIANDDLDSAFASMYAQSSGAAGTAKAAIIAEARSEANKAVSDITISADKITLDGTTWADTIFSNLISADTILSEVNGTKYLYVKNTVDDDDHIAVLSSNGLYFEQPSTVNLNVISSGTIDTANCVIGKSRCSKSQLALYKGGKVDTNGYGAIIDANHTTGPDFRMAGSNGAIQIGPRSISISSKTQNSDLDVASPKISTTDDTIAFLRISTDANDVINGKNAKGTIYISPSDFYLQNKTTGNYIQWMSDGSNAGGILNVRGAIHASGYATISLAAAQARANSLDEEEDETVSTTLGPVSQIFMVTDESKEAAFYCSGDEIGFINKSDLTKSNAGKITSYWAEIDYLNITENHHITSDTQDQDTLVITGHEAVQLGTNSKRDWINIIQNDNIARINSTVDISDDINLTHNIGNDNHITKINASAILDIISDYSNKSTRIRIDGGNKNVKLITNDLYIGSDPDYITHIISSDDNGTEFYSADPDRGFEFNGPVTVYGTISDSSDSTLKDIVSDTTLTVEQIANAPAVNFTWKKDADKENKKELVGTLAQYWQVVLPQVVGEGKDGKLNMQYGNAAMVSSIVTAKEVVALKERIAELERKLNELTSNQ